MSISREGNMRSNKNIRPAPSEIEYKNMKFLITDRPNDTNMGSYVEVSLFINEIYYRNYIYTTFTIQFLQVLNKLNSFYGNLA